MRAATRRRGYTREYKLAAVRVVTEAGVSLAEAARCLGLSENRLWRWKRDVAEKGDRAFPGRVQPTAAVEPIYQLMRDKLRLQEDCGVLRETVAVLSERRR